MRGEASERSKDLMLAWMEGIGPRRRARLAVHDVAKGFVVMFRAIRGAEDEFVRQESQLFPPGEEPAKPKRAQNYLMRDGTPRGRRNRLALPPIGGTSRRVDEMFEAIKRGDKEYQKSRIKRKRRVGGGALVRVGAQRLDRRG